jgi:hypothetical protein
MQGEEIRVSLQQCNLFTGEILHSSFDRIYVYEHVLAGAAKCPPLLQNTSTLRLNANLCTSLHHLHRLILSSFQYGSSLELPQGIPPLDGQSGVSRKEVLHHLRECTDVSSAAVD